MVDTQAEKSPDTATFMNERNMHASARERSARKSGLLPKRLDPLDSSRSKQKTNSAKKVRITEETQIEQGREMSDSHETVRETVPMSPIGSSNCIDIASKLQNVATDAHRCFDSNEIRKLVGLHNSSVLPICIAIVMSLISFTLGIYLTTNGFLQSFTPF